MLSFHSTSLTLVAVVLVALSTSTFLSNDVVVVVNAQIAGMEPIDQVVAQEGEEFGNTDPVPAVPATAEETPAPTDATDPSAGTADEIDFDIPMDDDLTQFLNSNATTTTDEDGDEFDAVSIGGDDGNTTFAPTSADTKVTFAPTTFEPTTFLPTESPTTFLPTATYPPTNVNGEKGDSSIVDVDTAAAEPGAESNMELDDMNATTSTTMAPSVATVVVAPPVPTPTDPTVSPVQDWTDPVPATGSGGVTAVGSSSSTRLLFSLVVVSVFVVLC